MEQTTRRIYTPLPCIRDFLRPTLKLRVFVYAVCHRGTGVQEKDMKAAGVSASSGYTAMSPDATS